jgi:hypothetical protein
MLQSLLGFGFQLLHQGQALERLKAQQVQHSLTPPQEPNATLPSKVPPPPKRKRKATAKSKPPRKAKILMKSYEHRIRTLLQLDTKLNWKKRRPKCLMNTETGKPLELDLYCEELNLAVEFHGIQHFKVIPYYHPRGQIDLDEQRARDIKKLELCELNGIPLAVISWGEINEDTLDVQIVEMVKERLAGAVKKVNDLSLLKK